MFHCQTLYMFVNVRGSGQDGRWWRVKPITLLDLVNFCLFRARRPIALRKFTIAVFSVHVAVFVFNRVLCGSARHPQTLTQPCGRDNSNKSNTKSTLKLSVISHNAFYIFFICYRSPADFMFVFFKDQTNF